MEEEKKNKKETTDESVKKGSKLTIKIGGRCYPCYATMGAALRFKGRTFVEVNDIRLDSISEMLTYLWCCVKSACNREGMDFDMDLQDFADALSPEEMTEWADSVVATAESSEAEAEDGKKK